MNHCLLCHSESTALFFEGNSHLFYKCSNCGTVFRDPDTFISVEDEKARYLTHNNDVEDERYQQFVSPITASVLKDFTSKATGLDFGAGTGPVITKVLKDNGYHIELYDPFFHPDNTVLERTYDFIVCCEVIEHFHNPLEEFKLLKRLLNPGGKLYCMSDILVSIQEFDKWYYKDDPTHVIFYSEENLQWIRKASGFSNVFIDNRLIIFPV
ncbi:MAG: class I SAM-dependent methyltransferase [Bacteroidia bacterium]|nr:class I SAM-dependent methyltransferase [Bacteroidia bacterium]MBT8275046.1 class I SAM-dependent methyltransferase [Bacteroidia bacterium]NNJ82839.1 class I SAM-dependent methyltransferase [Flavobacteriaceae bacterium]NNM08170.1 class I SAM-dependent methyltransferase [Flavobacteriaceae bacterium]